jgi:hypothetical protein
MQFSDFITEQKNTHMTHIEDKVLYGGVRGTREAINALRELRNMLVSTRVMVSSLSQRKASSTRTQKSTRLQVRLMLTHLVTLHRN